ncbi:TPA: hypothetical protein DEB00_04005 [Candidatus Uhrbacteria bacterium]|nr:hypothetical protein [Candidatus Uhrbacteria bacterium]
MSSGRSQRALRLFAVLVVPFTFWQIPDWSPRPVFLVTDAQDGMAHLHKSVDLEPGLTIPARGTIQTQTSPATLTFEETTLILDSRSQVQIKAITSDRIQFFSTRGHIWITPDRPVTFCTRAVCTSTFEPFELYYYTPGEITEVRTSGVAQVTFNETTYHLVAGDRITIDELTHTVRSTTE